MKDTRYFPHDQDARNDPKIKALIRKYSILGYAYYFITIEIMRSEKGYCIKDKPYIWDSISGEFGISVDEVKEFFDLCVELDLFERDGDFFFSPSLLKRMNILDSIRLKKRNAAYIMHSKYNHNIIEEPSNDNNE